MVNVREEKIVLSFVRKEEIPFRERTDLSKVRWESTKPLESLDYLYLVIFWFWFNRTVILFIVLDFTLSCDYCFESGLVRNKVLCSFLIDWI